VAINIPGQSAPEDLVNMYKSGGTASDPILIARNKLNGGGPSLSGFGLQLADQGGQYIVAEDNILVNPGFGGLGLASTGCCDIIVRNNKVYSDDKRDFTGVGLSVGVPSDGGCRSNITVENNEITFWQAANLNGSGTTEPFLAPFWNESTGCDDIAGWSTNKFDTGSAQPANLDNSLWNPAWNTPSFLPDNPYYYGNGAL
jgi:hypothetical protein